MNDYGLSFLGSGARPNRREALIAIAASAALALPACRANSAAPAPADALTPESFGAVGDGATDDTHAFLALSAHLNAHNGGVVSLRPGATYRIGRQSRGRKGFLVGEPILYAENVARFVVLMNGATLKFRDGMKFGSFSAASGKALRPRLPFVDRANAADIGHAIMARNVRHFEVRNGTVDGNSHGAVLGGDYGDTGRQLVHYGVSAYDCANVLFDEVHVLNSCLDGFLYEYAGLKKGAAPRPFVMRGCSAKLVARNCVSITGTNSALIERCHFSRAGEAPNRGLGAPFGSNPKSCFDIEAEGGVCRNVTIRGSQLVAGAYSNTCFVADSGDSADILVDDCQLVGTVWTSKPRTTFRNSRINGSFGRLAAGFPDPRDNSLIDGCHISDLPLSGAKRTAAAAISGQGAGATTASPLVIRNSVVDLHYHALNLRWTRLENVTINVFATPATIESGGYIMFLAGAVVRGLRINDRIPPARAPQTPFYVHEALAADIADAAIASPAEHIYWTASSRAGGGHTGRFRSP